MAVMKKAIEHGGDGSDIAEQSASILDGTVGSQQCTGTVVTARE
jgi:hypothetical protein